MCRGCSLFEASSANPKAAGPGPSGRDRLKRRILSLVRHVHPINDGGKRLEANKFAGLAFGRTRQPDRCNRISRTEQSLHDFAFMLNPEVGPTFGVALQVR